MLDYHAVKRWDFGEMRQRYNERDLILYALGAGYGFDPTDDGQLRFVHERVLAATPTYSTVLCSPGAWWTDPRTGVDYSRNLHGEQDLEIFAPLPLSGEVIGRNRVLALHDREPAKGALAEIERDIIDAATGALLARSRRIEVLRSAGGFSAVSGASDPRPAMLPGLDVDGPPDLEIDLPCAQQAALIYRLSGDYNMLHVDPATARRVGFPQPILHGLCTFAMAGHAVLRGFCGYDGTRLRRLAVRFSAPVYPGDLIRFSFWRGKGSGLRFRAVVPARGTKVLDNGLADVS